MRWQGMDVLSYLVLASATVGYGDIFFQLSSILFWIAVIGFIVMMYRNSKKKNEQLQRIEEKMDKVLELLDKKQRDS
jgi:general stress protein CsbA